MTDQYYRYLTLVALILIWIIGKRKIARYKILSRYNKLHSNKSRGLPLSKSQQREYEMLKRNLKK